MKRNGQNNQNTTGKAGSSSFAAFACAAACMTVFSSMLNVSLGIFVVAIILVLSLSLLAVLCSLRLIRREPPSYTA